MAKGRFRRRLKWAPGDLFAVPLCDGSFGFAQALAPVESWAVDFALLVLRSPAPELSNGAPQPSDALAVHASWKQTITGGHWGYVGACTLLVDPESCPNQKLIATANAVGTSHSEWGLLEDMLSAYHGLFPWNLYPAFDFDSYLLPGVRRPPGAVVLSPDQLALASADPKERPYAA
jgi:hypothetical protein